MPSKIKLLPEHVANKIAAGEVVQRPESVVKELMENSLDANATIIQLFIKDAGKSLIQVIDDGDGMTEEDAELCLLRHATSKISMAEDLEEIKSFGFRGEALAAISAVSRIEIKTKTADSPAAVLIQNNEDGSITKNYTKAEKGTLVAVKNLFYNTPARRNFLKSTATEFRRIVETFKRIAISHPKIAFKFYNENELIYDLKPSNLEKRIADIFGASFLENLIFGTEKLDIISLSAYLIKPNYLKKNKGDQYLFVNNRFVINKQINHAIYSAYENMIEKGDYPFFIAFLNVDPKRIDINVHPSKLEVKFDDDNFIYSFVKAVAKKIISEHNLIPSLEISDINEFEAKTIMSSKNSSNLLSDRNINSNENKNYIQSQNHSLANKHNFSIEKNIKRSAAFSSDEIDKIFDSLNLEKKDAPQSQTSIFTASQLDKDEKYPFIAQLHNRYILAQIKSGLAIIDQHIAHERILYEKILKTIEQNLPFSQQLLMPLTYEISPEDIEIIKEIKPYLESIGYNFEIKSNREIIIFGTPSVDFGKTSPEEIFLDVINEYKINNQKKIDAKDNIAKSYSCKAAIKAGDPLTEKQMRMLVEQLFMTSMPYVCPHGRPVMIKLTLEELDKQFGRI